MTIDTSPINTTDFDLSETEKRLLVETGRLAAYEYLGAKRRAADASQRIAALRQEVNGIRLGRAFRYFSLVALQAACLAGVLTWVYTWNANRNVPQYGLIDSPRYAGHYIQNDDTVGTLDDLVVRDWRKNLAEYSGNYAKNCFKFDSVFQIIISNGTTATKVVLSEGVYDGSQSIIKATMTQDAEGKAQPDAYPFCFDDPQWTYGAEWSYTRKVVTDRSTSIEWALKEQYLAPGQPFKLLGFSTYKDVFVLKDSNQNPQPVEAIDWILFEHRLLSPKGKATYWLIGEPGTSSAEVEVVFPEYSYISDKGSALIPLSRPVAQRDDKRGWERAKAALDFLRRPEVKQAIGEEKQELLKHVISTMDKALEKNQERRTAKGYIFTFDRSETKHLEESGNVNIVIFGQNLTYK